MRELYEEEKLDILAQQDRYILWRHTTTVAHTSKRTRWACEWRHRSSHSRWLRGIFQGQGRFCPCVHHDNTTVRRPV